MANSASQLADKLSAALGDNKDRLRKQYETAVANCDDAWDGVQGAMASRLYVLTSEAHADFRKAYDRKVAAYSNWLVA